MKVYIKFIIYSVLLGVTRNSISFQDVMNLFKGYKIYLIDSLIYSIV